VQGAQFSPESVLTISDGEKIMRFRRGQWWNYEQARFDIKAGEGGKIYLGISKQKNKMCRKCNWKMRKPSWNTISH